MGPTAPASSLAALNTLHARHPLHWPALGWRDHRRAPAIGLYDGACITAMGWALLAMFDSSPVLGHASWLASRTAVADEQAG